MSGKMASGKSGNGKAGNGRSPGAVPVPGGGSAPGGHGPGLRIDKYLWFVRLAPSRSVAQALAERGIIRLNGRRIDRAHVPVRVGDLITVPQGLAVRVIRVEQLPARRGPASEAQLCYSAILPGSAPDGAAPTMS